MGNPPAFLAVCSSINIVHGPVIANEIPGKSVGSMRIWTYQKNQLVDYVEKAGTSESRPLLIENGVITKIIGPNYDVRFTYNTKQRVTKQENYVNGVLNDYYLQTWTDAKPSSAALPAFKGFPLIDLFSESGQESTYAVLTNPHLSVWLYLALIPFSGGAYWATDSFFTSECTPKPTPGR